METLCKVTKSVKPSIKCLQRILFNTESSALNLRKHWFIISSHVVKSRLFSLLEQQQQKKIWMLMLIVFALNQVCLRHRMCTQRSCALETACRRCRVFSCAFQAEMWGRGPCSERSMNVHFLSGAVVAGVEQSSYVGRGTMPTRLLSFLAGEEAKSVDCASRAASPRAQHNWDDLEKRALWQGTWLPRGFHRCRQFTWIWLSFVCLFVVVKR